MKFLLFCLLFSFSSISAQEVWHPNTLIHKTPFDGTESQEYTLNLDNPCGDSIRVDIDFDNLWVPDRYKVVTKDITMNLWNWVGDCGQYPMSPCMGGFVLMDNTGINGGASIPADFYFSPFSPIGLGRITFVTTDSIATFTTYPNPWDGTEFYVYYQISHLVTKCTYRDTIESSCVLTDTLIQGVCCDTLRTYVTSVDTMEINTCGDYLDIQPYFEDSLITKVSVPFEGIVETQGDCKKLTYLRLTQSISQSIPNETHWVTEDTYTLDVSQWDWDLLLLSGEVFHRQPQIELPLGNNLVILMDSNGCESKFWVSVKKNDIYIPNAFSPNGDGINDTFEPQGDGILGYEINIFDQWGGEVFKGDAPWDGTNRGALLNTDVYVYAIVVRFENESKLYKGGVHLMR